MDDERSELRPEMVSAGESIVGTLVVRGIIKPEDAETIGASVLPPRCLVGKQRSHADPCLIVAMDVSSSEQSRRAAPRKVGRRSG